MAVLARGSKYGLSQCKSSDKTLCYVKLTDSALKAIEEFSRQRACFGGDKDAQIQFSKNEGIIRIPSLQGEGNRACTSSDPQWFKFNVASSAEQDGPHCSNECVQQTKQQSLHSLGPLLYRLRIQAKDDVYETTKQRMTSAREESEKNCTKMIKPCAMVGRMIKVKSGTTRPHPTVPATTSKPEPPRAFGSRENRRPGFSGRGPGPGPGSSNGPLSSSGTTGTGASQHQPVPGPPKFPGSVSRHSGQSSSALPSASSIPGAAKASGPLVNQRHSSPASTNSRRSNVTDIMKKPLRERIVHLLAVRSYKKPELVDRLRRDGLREKDKVTEALNGISYMKDNTYHLAKHAWSEVNEDWPFYTLQDKQTIKWRKPETLTPPSDSSSSSGHSPVPSSGSTSPPGNGSYKRPGFFDPAEGIPTKKVRISHYKRPQAGPDETRIILPHGNGPQSGPGSSLVCGSGISFGSRGSLKPDMLPGSKPPLAQVDKRPDNFGDRSRSDRRVFTMTDSARDELSKRQSKSLPTSERPSQTPPTVASGGASSDSMFTVPEWGGRSSGRYGQSTTTCLQPTPESSPDARRVEENELLAKKSSKIANAASVDTSDFSPEEIPEDFLKSFGTIETWEQRNQYKAIFNKEYDEYRKLYAKFNGIAQEFSDLEAHLKKCEAGSEARAGARKRIQDHYDSTKNADYIEKRRRLSYLHAKLAHIKRLVVEFHEKEVPTVRAAV